MSSQPTFQVIILTANIILILISFRKDKVEELTQALRLANAEVEELRGQCNDLRSKVQRTENHPSRLNPKLPPEIARMSEDEAKQTLAVRAIYPNSSNQ